MSRHHARHSHTRRRPRRRRLHGQALPPPPRVRTPNAEAGRDVRAGVSCPFDKGGGGSGGGGRDLCRERSDAADGVILIFFFQLDLATRVQCALNMEQYEVAKQLRNKLTGRS